MNDEAPSNPEGGRRAKPRNVILSIILVTHDSATVLPGLFTSLAEFPPAVRWELIAVDNASGDGSIELLRSRFPSAVIIANRSNRGFATGVNEAARHASGEFLLLANPDVSWRGDVIDHLLRFLKETPRAGAVSPVLRFPDGRPQPSSRRFPNHWNIWFSRGVPWISARWFRTGGWAYTLPDPDIPSRRDAVAGACLLLRRQAFDAVGGMDAGYFLYVEDTDLCRRLAEAGWDVWLDPRVSVTHRWGGRENRDPRLRREHLRGIRRYFKKFYPRKRVRNAVLFLALGIAAFFSPRPRRKNLDSQSGNAT